MDVVPLTLRDRKRQQTRARLEQAAVELVLEVGLAHATIEAICDAADVSPRTFFNYFDSKEDAILGLPLVDIDDDLVTAQQPVARDQGVASALVGLIVELARPVLENRELHRSRTEILRRHPELFSRQLTRLTTTTEELLGAVRSLMAHDPRSSAGAASPLAEPILALCSAGVRLSAKEWIAAGSDEPIDTIAARAIALTRETVERLR
jgi:AcrR family transcriptional regulator